MKLKGLKVTPTLAVAGAYAANDQVGGINLLANAIDSTGGQAVVRSLVLLDAAKQSIAMDVLFFDELPVVTSVDNGAFTLTDAHLLDKCIGSISVAAGNYVNTANSSVATVTSTGVVLQAKAKSKDLYCILVTRGAPTYAAGDLKIILGLEPA